MRPRGAVVRPRTICWSEPQMFVETTLRIAPCGVCRPTLEGCTPGPARNSKVGNSISCTSTVPGPRYATPLFVSPIVSYPRDALEGGHAGFSDLVILFDGAAAHAYRTRDPLP